MRRAQGTDVAAGGAVSIVGCSLGGVYARELARRRPATYAWS